MHPSIPVDCLAFLSSIMQLSTHTKQLLHTSRTHTCAAAAGGSTQVQDAMDDWTANVGGGGPPRRDRPQGWRDGQDRYGTQSERGGFARPRGLTAEPYQVGICLGGAGRDRVASVVVCDCCESMCVCVCRQRVGCHLIRLQEAV